MKRFLPLLMLTGLLFGQDVLHLKSGESYKGTFYGKVGEDIVFKVEGETSTKKFSINDVETIVTKNGELSYPFDVPNIALDLALEEYQKLSTEEKGIYDAKSKNLGKWYLFGPMSTILFGGCVLLKDYFNKKQGLKKDMTRLESPIFLGGSLAASLTIPYFVFNRKEKINFPKSILTDSEKEIYKQTYSKKLRQRKFRYAAVSTTVSVVIVAVAVASFDLDMSGGFGGGGNWGMGGYSGP